MIFIVSLFFLLFLVMGSEDQDLASQDKNKECLVTTPTWKCANCSPLCDPSTTARVPMSVVTSPTGVHRVNSWAVPRDMYTLSTWAPVNASWVGDKVLELELSTIV